MCTLHYSAWPNYLVWVGSGNEEMGGGGVIVPLLVIAQNWFPGLVLIIFFRSHIRTNVGSAFLELDGCCYKNKEKERRME